MTADGTTRDFRGKYIAIGHERGRAEARAEFRNRLERLAGSADLELAIQHELAALQSAAAPAADGAAYQPSPAAAQTLALLNGHGASAPGDIEEQVHDLVIAQLKGEAHADSC